MIFVNFKTYEEGSGARAVALTKILEDVGSLTSLKIIPVVQALDAETIINSSKLEVWIQHIDPITYGAHTGWTLPEEVANIGARGVFLNHSEHKFENLEILKTAIEKCKRVNLKTLVFASDLLELETVLELKPDYVSYEPAELVGATDKSVASEKPEIIKEAADLSKAKSTPLIVGAGIHSMEDVRKSIELGASGIAVATNIVKAQDPKKALLELAEGFK